MTPLLLATLLWVSGQVCATPAMTPPTDAAAQVSSSYGKLPLSFEINRGQTDGQVKFLARGQGFGLFLTPREAVLSLRAAPAQTAQARAREPATGKEAKGHEPARSAVVRMRLARANASPELSGLDPLPGKSNYFIGNDPDKWQREVAHYARVKYAGVYPGIDLVYYGKQRQLEYDFVLAPGADPKRIELVFEGTRRLSLDQQGNLILATAIGNLVQHRPVMYQEAKGKRTEVEGRYVLRGGNRAGFRVSSYDARRPLVIDPVLSYSTYLGGSGQDGGYAVAVDASGNAYVTGHTASSNFPTTGAYQRAYGNGTFDAFVTKLNATGTALVYSTYLGGSGEDEGDGIVVDASGNAYVSGTTASSNFPTTVGAYQTVYGGGPFDVFVTKLNATGGALVYSTFLGGSDEDDSGYGIALDGSGNAYLAGSTASSNFPTTAGAYQRVYGGGDGDAFVTKLNAAGTALVYSTYLGGSLGEQANSIAVDASGNAYVTGLTTSRNFPTTARAYQSVYGSGLFDAFVIKLDATGTAPIYSTYLGGSDDDEAWSIAVDASGNAYVTGVTASTNFPTTAGAYQTVYGGGPYDVFVAKLNATGAALVYSTYLGGNGDDGVNAIAVDASGNAYVTGLTSSSNFPTTTGAYQTVYGGGDGDAFVTKLSATGTALVYSTYLGGSGGDGGNSIAVDSGGNAYVAGSTVSSNFPTAEGAYQRVYGGGTYDAFVAKFTGLDTPQTSQTDCLFNWAERTYASLFAPAGAISNTFAPYYYRYYPQTNAYLATSSADNHVYYLGPLSNNSILDAGALSSLLSTAGCQ